MTKYSDNPIIEALFPVIDNSKCPENFSDNLKIGVMAGKTFSDNYGAAVTFWPALSTIPEFTCLTEEKVTELQLHTHGIFLCVDNIGYNIHNSQIISILPSKYEDVIKYKKSGGDRAALGWLVGGVLGAAVGAVSGIGEATKKIEMNLININFWDIQRRCAQSIFLEYNNSELDINKFISNWEKEKEINNSQNREPKGNDLAGINKNSGCLAMIGFFVFIGSLLSVII